MSDQLTQEEVRQIRWLLDHLVLNGRPIPELIKIDDEGYLGLLNYAEWHGKDFEKLKAKEERRARK